jgi:myo-inositol-hexaphosphate 3-phosphohydrolase
LETKSGNVKLIVYDISGRQVIELINGTHNEGKYEYDFNASGFASGAYFYKLVIDLRRN